MNGKSPVSASYDRLHASRQWKTFSHDYETLVFSVTSFAAQRQMILRNVVSGVVADIGCGPLGHLLRDIAQLPKTWTLGSDFCWEMILGSRERTKQSAIHYILTDNRCLALGNSSVDTIVSVNSILPETRAEVEVIFQEVGRVLRKGGRLVAVLPSFEMSLVARDRWGMEQRLDLQNHREWDTSGWQCFFASVDIDDLMKRHQFARYRVERMTFSSMDEIDHIRRVYADRLQGVPLQRLAEDPLFEHLLVAER
jgi:SAM-dependent methyltransferase